MTLTILITLNRCWEHRSHTLAMRLGHKLLLLLLYKLFSVRPLYCTIWDTYSFERHVIYLVYLIYISHWCHHDWSPWLPAKRFYTATLGLDGGLTSGFALHRSCEPLFARLGWIHPRPPWWYAVAQRSEPIQTQHITRVVWRGQWLGVDCGKGGLGGSIAGTDAAVWVMGLMNGYIYIYIYTYILTDVVLCPRWDRFQARCSKTSAETLSWGTLSWVPYCWSQYYVPVILCSQGQAVLWDGCDHQAIHSVMCNPASCHSFLFEPVTAYLATTWKAEMALFHPFIALG